MVREWGRGGVEVERGGAEDRQPEEAVDHGVVEVGLGARDDAKATWQRALETPHARKDLSLQSDLEQRLRDLEDF